MPAAKTSAKKRTGPGKAKGKKATARKAARVVRKVVKSTGGKAPSEAKLFSELEILAEFIKQARIDIAELSPDEVKHQFLPTASDELDAIIAATADATNAIMDATEIIEEVVIGLDGKDAGKMMKATTMIYEACGFQDITGQRITKVVSTLQEIEKKIDGLISAFDDGKNKRVKKKPKAKKKKKSKLTDEDLLHGPQAEGEGKSQSEVDDLLASFD
jgi:chemotaxis protein CheZ